MSWCRCAWCWVWRASRAGRSDGAGHMKKPQRVGGTAGVLVRDKLRRLGLGAKRRPVVMSLRSGAFPKLYKVAHSEMTVDKSNNSTSGLSANHARSGDVRCRLFPPNTARTGSFT
jgi:hypothetical protein